MHRLESAKSTDSGPAQHSQPSPFSLSIHHQQMRFFKAFNLLHRRTGSATFVPGGPRFSLGSADPNPAASLSLFDLVTSRKPFSDVKDDHWWSRRSRDTNSLTNIQPSLRQEHRHPVEFVDFWIEECSKLRDLLKCCHTELLDQRSITIALERKINESSQEIAYLRMSLAGGILAGPPATSTHDQIPIVHAAASRNITTISTNSHTSDQYSSALRVTLQTRKALRDQKKITKYWKNLAVTGPQNTVTPSVSAISSIRESLPAHRQVAVEALMARRSLNTLLDDLRSESILSEVLCSTSEEINRHSFHAGLHETATILPSSLSRGPQLSRLGPLASESIKHEVNLLFGSSSRPKRLSSSISSLQFRNSFSSKEELSHTTSFSHSINSFRDLNTFFQVNDLVILILCYCSILCLREHLVLIRY